MSITTTNLGKVAIVPKGAYDNATQYERLDLVTHGGASYLALKSNLGLVPIGNTDANWLLLAQNGVDTYMNVTLEVPLSAGQYYTLATGLAAVATAGKEKNGFIMLIETAAGVWNTYQFIGNVATEWTNTAKWQYFDFDSKIDKAAIKQVLGTSTTDVMSQKAVTDELSTKANHGYESNPKTLKEVDDNLVQLAGDIGDKITISEDGTVKKDGVGVDIKIDINKIKIYNFKTIIEENDYSYRVNIKKVLEIENGIAITNTTGNPTFFAEPFKPVVGHKYFLKYSFKQDESNIAKMLRFGFINDWEDKNTLVVEGNKSNYIEHKGILEVTKDYNYLGYTFFPNEQNTFHIKYGYIVDITEIYGEGNEPDSPDIVDDYLGESLFDKINDLDAKDLLLKSDIEKIETDIGKINSQQDIVGINTVKKNLISIKVPYYDRQLNFIKGMGFNASTGVNSEYAHRLSTEFIEVEEEDVLYIQANDETEITAVFYDGDKNLIEIYRTSDDNAFNYNITSGLFGIKYVRITSRFIDERDIISNDISQIGDVYFVRKKDGFYKSVLGLKSSKPNHINFQVASANTRHGGIRYYNTKVINDLPYFAHNEIITITPPLDGKFIVLYYDRNMSFVRADNWSEEDKTIEIKDGEYLRFLFGFKDDRVIVNGDVEHLSAGINVKGIYEDGLVVSGGGGNGEYYFRSQMLPDTPIGSSLPSYEEFINQTWETLRAKFPDEISRNVIIRDSSDTHNIYEYVFTPANYTKTVFLMSGMHGDEYEGYWSLFRMMRNIWEYNYKYRKLRDIKYNVRFVIVPIANPYSMELAQRLTVNGLDANLNFDVFFNSPEYVVRGGTPFSENENIAIKMIADKYDSNFDLFIDFHTDPYEPYWGNYIIANKLSALFNASVNLVYDEVAYLKDKFNFNTRHKPDILGVTRNSGSYKWMEAYRNVPSAIIEVSTGGNLGATGSGRIATIGLDWFTNFLIEMLKHDLVNPIQIEKGLEKAIVEGRADGYINSINKKIVDDGLIANIDYNDFNDGAIDNRAKRGDVVLSGVTTSIVGLDLTSGSIALPTSRYDDLTLLYRGTINGIGNLLESNTAFGLSIVNGTHSNSYSIKCGDNLVCSALKYGEDITVGIRFKDNQATLFVKSEPFNTITCNTTGVTDLTITSLNARLKNLIVYNRALSDVEFGFAFKSINY